MSNNALRNILIGATVFVLGVILVVRRGSLSALVPSDTPTLAADATTGEHVSFFRGVGGMDARVEAVTDSAKGAGLFKQKGCTACHRIGGQGPMGIGPDLSRIGGAPYDGLPNTAEFLAKWLDNPSAQKAGTMMPRIPLTPAERDALVRYLTSLK